MKRVFFLIIVSAVFMPFFARALIATSVSFRIIEPVIQVLGGFASSTTYQLNQSVAQLAIGTSSVASSFRVSSGFLYYPFATRPVVTPTAGDASVALSWTASQGFLGWNVSGYNVGQSTTSGGPYTYSASLGNVISSTRTGLSNGTTYYFVVRAEDAFQNSIATSTEVSATPVAGAAVPETPTTPVGGNGPIIDLIILITGVPPVIPEGCSPISPIDLNCDGKVGIQDLSIFLYFQAQPSPNPADFNDDLRVNLQDLSALFSRWTERVLNFVPEGAPRVVVEEGRVTRRDSFAAVREAVGEKGAESKEGGLFEGVQDGGRRFIDAFFGFFGRVLRAVTSFVGQFLGRVFGW
ncbi:MAG: hypothetical protein Q7R73_00095 [bacterium]|nr:hypothetical protein [bacterium]